MPLILGANSLAGGGYQVDNSLRFNTASSDYLNRSAVTGDRRTFTISAWVKRSKLGSEQQIYSSRSSASNVLGLYFQGSNDTLLVTDYQSGGTMSFTTSAVYRDVSAWYHIVLAVDTTQATNTNRVKLYVNGEQVTFSASSYPTLDRDLYINVSGSNHYIGTEQSGRYFDGYMSDVYLIDGQALTPTDFGEFDADSGVWKPIVYEGTYGTNGFFLEFKDSSALGDDTSGNTNDFTVNNLTSIDQTTDTPTNNFTLLNTLNYSSSTRTYGEGNTAITASGSGDWNTALNNIGVRSGKWYAEFKINSVGSFSAIGVTLWPVLSPVNPSATLNFTFLVGEDAGAYGWRNNGARPQGGSSLSSWGTNDILMIAMDMDNLKVYFGKNGTWETSGDPESGATGTGSIGDLTADQDYFFVICPRGGSTYCNFGNPAFTIASGNTDGNDYGNFEYAVPAGYYALCTANLAEFG
jgi:hypothetical protein